MVLLWQSNTKIAMFNSARISFVSLLALGVPLTQYFGDFWTVSMMKLRIQVVAHFINIQPFVSSGSEQRVIPDYNRLR